MLKTFYVIGTAIALSVSTPLFADSFGQNRTDGYRHFPQHRSEIHRDRHEIAHDRAQLRRELAEREQNRRELRQALRFGDMERARYERWQIAQNNRDIQRNLAELRRDQRDFYYDSRQRGWHYR